MFQSLNSTGAGTFRLEKIENAVKKLEKNYGELKDLVNKQFLELKELLAGRSAFDYFPVPN